MSPHRLRIAIDGRPALWARTGIGTIAQNVLEKIQAVDSDNEYIAYFDRDPGEAARAYGSITCRFGGPRHKLAWANTWLLRRLHCDRIDVYVSFLDQHLPLAPTRARVVSMIHDLIPLRFPDTVFRNTLHKIYYTGLIRAAAQRSDLILTNSAFSKDEIVRGLKLDEAKVQRIPLGVRQAGSIDPMRTAGVLQRYRLERPFAFAMGSTEPRKNNARVLNAMRLLEKKHPGLKLAIAGRAWRGTEFNPEMLSNRVRLLGYVADADLPVLMAAAEMLVFPSLHEGFGFPVVEAMALGVPVVTSSVTALPEVGGDAVLYADPHDAAEIAACMEQILTDAELVAALRSKGRERAERFRWSETCTTIASLCEGLMEKREWRTQPVTQ
jgi:glycosyltransferase involved in cell wall biosynthesis